MDRDERSNNQGDGKKGNVPGWMHSEKEALNGVSLCVYVCVNLIHIRSSLFICKVFGLPLVLSVSCRSGQARTLFNSYLPFCLCLAHISFCYNHLLLSTLFLSL